MKKFACFSNEKAAGDQGGCVSESPVSLDWDIFSDPQHILKTSDCSIMRSAPSDFVTKIYEKDDCMPRKYYLPGQSLMNSGVVLYVYFMILSLSCSEVDHVKSLVTAVKSAAPTGAISAVSSSALNIQLLCVV